MVNMAPIAWYSKKQGSIEGASFGSEFMALKTAVEANRGANAFLETLPSIALSAVNHIELIQGMRNRRELKALRDLCVSGTRSPFP